MRTNAPPTKKSELMDNSGLPWRFIIHENIKHVILRNLCTDTKQASNGHQKRQLRHTQQPPSKRKLASHPRTTEKPQTKGGHVNENSNHSRGISKKQEGTKKLGRVIKTTLNDRNLAVIHTTAITSSPPNLPSP